MCHIVAFKERTCLTCACFATSKLDLSQPKPEVFLKHRSNVNETKSLQKAMEFPEERVVSGFLLQTQTSWPRSLPMSQEGLGGVGTREAHRLAQLRACEVGKAVERGRVGKHRQVQTGGFYLLLFVLG